MPATVQDYSNRTIGEVVLFSMDFQLNLAPGEVINTATWACAIEVGTDSGAGARISGGATISGSVVSQLVTFATGVTTGNRYLLTCTCTTSNSETLIGYSHTTVNAAS